LVAVSGEPWFLADPLPTVGSFVLDGPEGRHAAAVRRMRPGEPLVLTDGRGGRATGTVTETGRKEITVQVSAVAAVAAPDLRVTLVQALPKGDRSELAVDLATEAGVDALVPWQAERCVARWTADKAARGVEKWRAVAREAAKQSRRPWFPRVSELASTADVVALIGRADRALVLHEAGARPFTAVPLPSRGDLVMVVGPEGGLSPAELSALTGAGGTVVRLGPQVLRTSTVGAVALGALGVLTGRWP
jgi:16S rRNA (uracil1498-N3)-methyltransferase